MKNPFGLHMSWNLKTSMCELLGVRQTRINVGTPTEFVFCNRKFGAVILDASDDGMKLSCEIKLGIGSIIHLVDPAMSGKIVWRNDKNKSMGIKFVKTSRESHMDPFN